MEQLLGTKIIAELPYDFASVFRYQFTLSPQPLALPDFEARQVGQYHLYTCPLLNTCVVEHREGDDIIVLGYAIDADGVILSGSYRTNPNQDIEQFIASLSGRFCVLYSDKEKKGRVYVDPASSYSVVYDTKTGIVASSLLLCLNRDIHPSERYSISQETYESRDIGKFLPEKDDRLPDTGFKFGHTPDKFVFHVLPNLYLDLSERRLVRWHTPSGFDDELSVEDAAEKICSRLGTVMNALSDNLRGYFSISGGRDSRVLFGCLNKDKPSNLTLHCYATAWINQLDIQVAEVMASAYGKDVLVQIPPAGHKGNYFPRRKRSFMMAQQVCLSTGFTKNSDDWWKRGYAQKLEPDVIWVRGNFLEILTARFWPKGKRGVDHDALYALRKGGTDVTNEAHFASDLELLEEWKGSFDHFPENRIHDLAYQELFLGASQPFFHGMNRQFYIGAASDRTMFDTTMRVGERRRMREELFDQIIRNTCPDLLDLTTPADVVRQARQRDVPAADIMADKLDAFVRGAS